MPWPYSPDVDPARRLPGPNQQPQQPQDQINPNSPFAAFAKSIEAPPDEIRQPFAGSDFDREGKDWGRPDAILEAAMRNPMSLGPPDMPGPRDIPQLMQNYYQNMTRIGSPQIAQGAMAMQQHDAAWWKGYMQADEWLMRRSHEQWVLERDKNIERQTQESQDYGVAVDLFKKDHNVNNFARRMMDAALKNGGDPEMIALIRDGKYEEAEDLAQARDGRNLELMKARHQERLLAIQERELDLQEAQTKKYLTPPPTPPTPPAAATGPAGPSVAANLPAVSDEMRNAAQRGQMGEKEKDLDIPDTQQARDATRQYRNLLDNAVRMLQKPEFPIDRVMPELQQINPYLADLTQNLLDGTSQPNTAESVKEPYATALRLAKKINPDFARTAATLEAQNKAMGERAVIRGLGTDFSNNMRALSRFRIIIPKNLRDMDQLAALAAKVDATGVPVLERWLRGGRQEVAGDLDATAFNSQLHVVRRDMADVLSAGSGTAAGRITVHSQKMMEDFLKGGETAQQINVISQTMRRDYENLLTPVLGEVNALKLQLNPKAEQETADEIFDALRGTANRDAIKAPPGAREGETLYFEGRPYRIQGDQAIPQ